MRSFILIGFLAATSVLATGIASHLHAATKEGGAKQPVELSSAENARLNAQREAFLKAPELSQRLDQLQNFEEQALRLAVDEPLKLGSLGSAILDIYPGSQTGHYAMSRFYTHVESAEAQETHENELALLQASMRASGNGTPAEPYQVMTIYDAHAFAASHNKLPVGSIYQSNQYISFGYVLVARPKSAPLEQTYFNISHILEGFIDHANQIAEADTEHQTDSQKQPPSRANPWTYIRLLASQMDAAAQTAIGSYLASVEKYDDAVTWLQVAARAENVLANALLARIYWTQADKETDTEKQASLKELAMENHLHAIALGSTDSMYTLASLYLTDYFGEDNRTAGVALLHQAGELQHVESLLYLGHIYNAGRDVKQNTATADKYFAQAAKLNNPRAIISYGRFLGSRADEAQSTGADESQIRAMLRKIADQDDPEAMVVLGNLHARGIGGRASNRRAIKWYKKAVKADTDNADIVNEVAWTLAVSDVDGLKRGKYAKQIMDRLMKDAPDMLRRPEYLDTWAAAHAAIGDFANAIELQDKAIEEATSQQRDDVLDILKGHLEKFRAGEDITERAP